MAGVAGLRDFEGWCQRRQGGLTKGETLSAALERNGLSRPAAAQIVAALRGVMDFRRLLPGEKFEILSAPSGTVERFVYRKSPLLRFEVRRNQGKLWARRLDVPSETRIEPVALAIEDTLYNSVARAGEDLSLVMELVDIFAWDIDFYIDPRPGDRVIVLVEKIFAEGQFAGYGRILAAQYGGNAIGVHRAFLYRRHDGREGFYDEDGGSLRKAFLKSPLKFTCISSGFGRRVHPILGFSHLHAAVDLAAPPGTPVWAPADGTVLFAGRQGAAGKMVKLRHANGYQTVFAHLKSISAAVKPGGRVQQKQVIGAVGSTGRATGPHLHYGMKKDGVWVNPFSQRFPPAEPVPEAERKDFGRVIAPLREKLHQVEVSQAEKQAGVTPAGGGGEG